jgi:hypothetical protein
MHSLTNHHLRTKFQFVWILMLLSSLANSQYAISGKIIDQTTKEPLAFVNIIINHDVTTGTTSDVNGRFKYTTALPITSLTCSYVGYEKVTLSIDSTQAHQPLLIAMHTTSIELSEVIIKPGENPANRIIRKVIENKRINNPENVSSFTYHSYNKVIYDFDYSDSLSSDEVKEQINSVFQGGHLFVMESVTERKFIRPDISEEIILGTKISGFKDASFAPLATDVQPFSFYKDIIPIFDVDYLNPISNGSLSKYDFTLKDTLYQGTDTTFILSYKPQAGKNFEGLTGLLYINTNQYAIQNVTARPFKPGFIDVNLQQQYSYVDGKQWFPEQLKFELFVHHNPGMEVGVKASGVSVIDHVVLNADLRKKDFGLDAIRMDNLANHRDSIFWTTNRTVPLNAREKITYQVLDSLGKEYKFDNLLKIMEKVGQNKVPIHFIDLDLGRLASYNKYEGVRLGLGVHTNDQLIKHLSLGGFFGYGFKDDGWKYGGDAILTISQEKEIQLKVMHQFDVRETGKTELDFFKPNQFDFRAWIASRMDRIQQSSIALNMRMLKFAKVNVSFSNTRIDPLYKYAFTPNDNDVIKGYMNTDVTINLRYAFKEKLIQSMGQRISMGSRYPVLSMTYTRGLEDVFSGAFRYNKFEARLEQSIYFRNLGESKIRINAGYIDSPLPYGLLFTGEGSYIQNWSVLVKNSFQTSEPYEFLSDEYVSLHYSHNFGSLLLQIGKFKPSITISQNIGWGTLSHPEYHQDINFKTKEKGLYESGLQLDNLVKFRYLNISYLGFGAGMYYRYGPYASGQVSDDLAFTFSMTFTTK